MFNGSESGSCSYKREDTDTAESKVDMWIAWKECERILTENGHMTESTSRKITPKIMQIATEMYNRIVPMFHETEEQARIKVEEFMIQDEDMCYDVTVQTSPSKNHANVRASSPEGSDWDDEPSSKRRDFISLAYKKKVVEMAKAHPKWSLKSLHSRGAMLLRRKSYLKTWEADIAAGGTVFDKFKVINDMTYKRFQEGRDNREYITTATLQYWARKFAREISCDSFVASTSWVNKFKHKYGISKDQLRGTSVQE